MKTKFHLIENNGEYKLFYKDCDPVRRIAHGRLFEVRFKEYSRFGKMMNVINVILLTIFQIVIVLLSLI